MRHERERRYRGFEFFPGLLAALLAALPAAANGVYGADWEPILENDLAAAVTEFRQGEGDLREVGDHQWALTANGLAMAVWSVGDYAEAADTWMRLCDFCFTRPKEDSPLRSTAFLEGYLAGVARALEQVRIDDQILPQLEKLITQGEEPDKSRVVGVLLFHLYRDRGDVEGVQRLAKDLGLITRWDEVSGPFGYSGFMDLEQPFDPETDPSIAPMQGYYGKVAWRKVPLEPPDGFLDLGALVYPEEGTAYARTALEASQAASGLLAVEGGGSVRAWWNGRLILSRDRRDLELEVTTTVPVEIRSGINHLLVKSRRDGDPWGHRVFVYPADPGSGVAIVPADPGGYPACHPDPASFLGARERHPIEDMARGSGAGEADIIDLLAGIYAAELARRDGRYEAAREYLEEVRQQAAAWCLPQLLLGDLAWQAAGERPASRPRLENEARTHYESALEASPLAIPAAVGLGEYFRTRKTFDSALEVLEEAQVSVAKVLDPAPGAGPALLRNPIPSLEYALGKTYEDLEYEAEGRRAYIRAREGSSGNPDVWIRLSALLRRAHAGTQAFSIAEEGHSFFPMERGLLTELANAAGSAAAEAKLLGEYERRLQLLPLDFGASRAAAEILEKLGRGDDARHVYEGMKNIRPEDPLPWIRQGDSLLRIADLTSPAEVNRLTEALGYLREGLARKPQDVDLARRVLAVERAVKELAGESFPADAKAPRDLNYDVDYFSLDQSRLAELPQEKANAVYLLDLMVKTLYPNGTDTSIIHQSVLLKNKEGRAEFSEIAVPRDAEILMARTIIPGGTTYYAETITDTGSDLSISMYGLEDGCVVDYAYRMTASGIPAPGGGYDPLTFFFGEITNPMLLSRLVLLVSDGVAVQWRSHPLDFAPRIERHEGYEAWSWEKVLSPGMKPESNLPPRSLTVPTAKLTTCPDWAVGMERAKGWLKGRRENEGKIAEVASLLALDVKTPREKIAKVYEYIQRVIEPGSFGGGTVIDTLKNRSGSAFDKVVLAEALLERMGIRSCIAAGYDPGDEERFPPVPSASYLARSVLMVPGDQASEAWAFTHPRDLWISFASRYLPLGEMNSSERTQLLFLFPPHGVVMRPPLEAEVAGGWIERHLAFRLDPEGESACRGTFYYHGDIRSGLRQAVADQSLRERILSSEISRTVRGIELQKSGFEGVDRLEEDLAIRFEGRVTRMLQPEDGGWSLDPIPDKSDLSGSAREPQREQPVKFEKPVVYNPYRASFQAPPTASPEEAPWVFRHIPGDTILISRFGAYALDYELEGDVLWVTRSAYVPAQWIEPKDYADFIEFCRNVDAAEKERILLRRVGQEEAASAGEPPATTP